MRQMSIVTAKKEEMLDIVTAKKEEMLKSSPQKL